MATSSNPVGGWTDNPATPPPLGPEDVHVWRAPLDPTAAARCAPLLSADERQRADAFRRLEDTARFTVGRGVLRLVLAHYVTASPAALQFSYGVRGKPLLESNPVHFNLSHAGGWLLVAVAARPVGIDVEQVRPEFVEPAVEDRVLSPEERELLEGADARIEGFFVALTAKEAYAKALGIGMLLPFDRLSVLPQLQSDAIAILPPDTEGAEGKAWRVETLEVGDEYRAAFVVAGREASAQTWNWAG